jgi:hypothetical protein
VERNGEEDQHALGRKPERRWLRERAVQDFDQKQRHEPEESERANLHGIVNRDRREGDEEPGDSACDGPPATAGRERCEKDGEHSRKDGDEPRSELRIPSRSNDAVC